MEVSGPIRGLVKLPASMCRAGACMEGAEERLGVGGYLPGPVRGFLPQLPGKGRLWALAGQGPCSALTCASLVLPTGRLGRKERGTQCELGVRAALLSPRRAPGAR